MSDNIYLARQPILDAGGRLFGFEPLFRSSLTNSAGSFTDEVATSSVVIRALSEFGASTVLDGYLGFINCCADFLMSAAIELLPPEKIVLEILENTAATEDLMARCQYLRNKGYRLALDNFLGITELNQEFLPLVYIVKVDIRDLEPDELADVTRQLAVFDTLLLAEKVETEAEFGRCKLLVYRYFQGYYFSRPEVIKGRSMTPGQMVLVRVMAILQKEDADIRDIEETFKEPPALGISLLRLANSAAFGLRSPLKSIPQRFLHWTATNGALDSTDDGRNKSDAKLSPLLHVAATRGKFMELPAPSWCNNPAPPAAPLSWAGYP